MTRGSIFGGAVPNRFVDRYAERERRRRAGEARRWPRPFRIVAGLVLLVTSVLIGWLPGPGFIPLALAGSTLIAGEVEWMARLLDRSELRIRAWAAEHRQRKASRSSK